jgi:hypothetical protein
MATGMLAEPVSGIVGMAALPFGADVAANAVRNTQQGLTYQPRTEAGQQGMQALQGFMQPIAETVSRQTDIASKVLAGNAGFDVNTPGGQFLTSMLPALAASAPGFTAARAIPGRRLEMGDIGAGGVGSRQRGMFAGVRANTADFDALDNAKNMKGQGATRDQIWNETGWFEDVDGSWKFEIDDSQSVLEGMNYEKMTKDAISQGDYELARRLSSEGRNYDMPYTQPGTQPISDVLRNDNLYEAYPSTGSIGFQKDRKLGPGEGAYSNDTNMVFMGDGTNPDSARSLMLHELQHGVQRREGFASGGGTEIIARQLAKRKQEASTKITDLNLEMRRVVKEMDDNPSKRSELEPVYLNLLDQRSQYVQDAGIDVELDAFNQYQRLAGEAEARNVQTRRDFTPQQRRDSTPWSTLDVPENELIIRRARGNKE